MAIAVWQHDENAPVHEAEIRTWTDRSNNTRIGFNHGAGDMDMPGDKLRMVLHALIWRVESRQGGWCEIKTDKGIIYRHPTGPY